MGADDLPGLRLSPPYITTNGHRADAIVLVTKTDPAADYEGFTLFLVPKDLPGVVREQRLEKLGMHASDTALLAFQDVRVPASAVLGEPILAATSTSSITGSASTTSCRRLCSPQRHGLIDVG